jgi:uncharacterized protein YbjQ (UPF0145 family)
LGLPILNNNLKASVKNIPSFQNKQKTMDKAMITTTFELEGFKVIQNFGLVRGLTVRSRSIFGNIGAGLQSLIGGNISILANLCEKTREEAFENMMKHGVEMGANAILGVRYDANEVMSGITEVLAYGTAVLVEKK